MSSAGYCLTIATAPDVTVVPLLDPLTPPANYTKPDTIAKWLAEAERDRLADLALHPATCLITAISWIPAVGQPTMGPTVHLCRNYQEERAALQALIALSPGDGAVPFMSYMGLRFVWPTLMFRARFHTLELTIATNRFRGPHIDLNDRIHDFGAFASKSMAFYTKRLGWPELIGPLTGLERALAPEKGQWEELAESVGRDVEAIRRLGVWNRYIDAESVELSDSFQEDDRSFT